MSASEANVPHKKAVLSGLSLPTMTLHKIEGELSKQRGKSSGKIVRYSHALHYSVCNTVTDEPVGFIRSWKSYTRWADELDDRYARR